MPMHTHTHAHTCSRARAHTHTHTHTHTHQTRSLPTSHKLTTAHLANVPTHLSCYPITEADAKVPGSMGTGIWEHGCMVAWIYAHLLPHHGCMYGCKGASVRGGCMWFTRNRQTTDRPINVRCVACRVRRFSVATAGAPRPASIRGQG